MKKKLLDEEILKIFRDEDEDEEEKEEIETEENFNFTLTESEYEKIKWLVQKENFEKIQKLISDEEKEDTKKEDSKKEDIKEEAKEEKINSFDSFKNIYNVDKK